MRTTVIHFCSALGIFAALISTPAFAYEAGAMEAQSVIQGQLDAFVGFSYSGLGRLLGTRLRPRPRDSC
jgi:hypothetical protein